jgi:hypothetical protein
VKTIDAPISDATFLLAEFATIRALPTNQRRLAAVSKLIPARWRDAGAGGFYDNLGAGVTKQAPHLQKGQGDVLSVFMDSSRDLPMFSRML